MPTEYIGYVDVEGITINCYRDYYKDDESTNHYVIEVGNFLTLEPSDKAEYENALRMLQSAKGRKMIKAVVKKQAEVKTKISVLLSFMEQA